MCPGGVIAPCATSPGEVVTNGWSPSKRDQATANSGIVVELKLEDFKPFAKFGALAGMEFQKSIEQKAWHLAGETQKVPAQKMVDFTQNKVSSNIPKTSYVPGTTSVEMGQVFPGFLTQILREGFVEFGKSMRGFLTNEAVLHAPESQNFLASAHSQRFRNIGTPSNKRFVSLWRRSRLCWRNYLGSD